MQRFEIVFTSSLLLNFKYEKATPPLFIPDSS
jgi:hypothetical protein